MGLILAATFGLVLWIVIWSIGYSGLDSVLLALIVMVLGAAGRVVLRHLTSGSSAPVRGAPAGRGRPLESRRSRGSALRCDFASVLWSPDCDRTER